MIPYFGQPDLELGPLTIHGWAALVVAAIVIAYWVIRARAREVGLDPRHATRLLSVTLLAGFVGAHLVDRLIYHPAATLADPRSLVIVWKGLSSIGGILGGIVGATVYMRHAGLDRRDLDALAFGFPLAWLVARLGCFLAYDHPGVATTAWIGQRYRDGVIRHNLGLEEALLMVPILAVFLVIRRRSLRPGTLTAVLALTYAPARFALDFLRAHDVRYAGLTPAQYGMIVLFIMGAWLLDDRDFALRRAGAHAKTRRRMGPTRAETSLR